MNIWIKSGDLPEDTNTPCHYGRFVTAVRSADGRETTLCVVRSQQDLTDRSATANSWYIGADQTSDRELLTALAATNRPVLAVINDRNADDLALLRRTIPTAALVLTVDATGTDDSATLEQLARISRHREPFALMADGSVAILAAAAMGASDVIVADPAGVDMGALGRIAAARRQDAMHSTAAETNGHHLAEKERCLTVRRPLDVGSIIGKDDLDVAVTEYRGLGAAMAEHVIGLRLRYTIAPGEALHFGHFHDRYAAKH